MYVEGESAASRFAVMPHTRVSCGDHADAAVQHLWFIDDQAVVPLPQFDD
jgi:hypothetical protein